MFIIAYVFYILDFDASLIDQWQKEEDEYYKHSQNLGTVFTIFFCHVNLIETNKNEPGN